MAQKNATPTKEQTALLKQAGLSAIGWVVVKEFANSMIVRCRITGEFKLIEKGVKTV